jgi:G:T-mismatch repair DNA endonuclease (very short patch repair protein)
LDTVSKKRRSEIMALVRGKNTRPEVVVRRLVTHLAPQRGRLDSFLKWLPQELLVFCSPP